VLLLCAITIFYSSGTVAGSPQIAFNISAGEFEDSVLAFGFGLQAHVFVSATGDFQ
jgi:hypothetical protein